MTHAEWLGDREPVAPDGLREPLQRLLAQHPGWNLLALPGAMANASEMLLARVLTSDASSRSVATDLLAADAFVTYAFEAAADEPQSIAPLADRSMQRIAVLAASDDASRVANLRGDFSPPTGAR